MENKTLDQLNVEQLKALAYDQMATIEAAQFNLKHINAEIAKRVNTPPVTQETPKVDNDST